MVSKLVCIVLIPCGDCGKELMTVRVPGCLSWAVRDLKQHADFSKISGCQILVVTLSNVAKTWSYLLRIISNIWQNSGQDLVNFGSDLCRILVKFRLNLGQILVLCFSIDLTMRQRV